jgi:hypothetical protein
MTGYKACLGFNACLPDTDCCVPGDCTAAHVKDYTCTPNGMPPTSSTCGIKDCDPSCYNLDGQYANGCECCDDVYGKTCATATALGSLTLGAAPITETNGVLPVGTEGDWFQVDFNSENNVAFHGLVQLTQGGGEYVFDIIQGSCGGNALSCGEGGTCTGKTAWEVSYSGPNPPGDPNSKTPSGVSNFQPIPAVGSVWIHVYRANTSMVTCNPYTLSVQE